jgi:hypothetical protein
MPMRVAATAVRRWLAALMRSAATSGVSEFRSSFINLVLLEDSAIRGTASEGPV